ncbi:hypothetical protein DACRYDRAFT_105575 [Dacryopinax primogenitus]|uniref:Peptidase A1 domain-containing protein n=1 Tax=Dacryopinax primogenitus (strain DJM 731) TaxID=1858805 RepID=M5G722_DACPD|nr:uncharacterized protein DACRYDRAFT_105575 [Dacryopinax primogenitus]EJU04519.1 hypothetical protein DACRYDRAFT_105575 [Dacryopinax primogenitus]
MASPASQRIVKTSSSSSGVDATNLFNHPVLAFDTGDNQLLGLPHDDWLTLMSLLGAQGSDSNGNFLIPCGSTMTYNFFGTKNREYTFSIADTTTNNGQGFCKPTVIDSGSTTNWITGMPFLHQYYVAFHYTANMMGFGTRNLGASAAQSKPFVG